MNDHLALVMIARDEAPRIGRCLDSVRPHVGTMIVLDTGSSDDTVAIARAHGAVVRHFTWADDFAAARNAALAHSPAAWNLVLDADEWLADEPAQVAAQLAAGVLDGAWLGVVCQLNEFELDGRRQTSRLWIPRLLPRGVRYAGRIHEQPESALPRRRLALHLGHGGYLPERTAAKAGRNATLLEWALAENPGDGYLWYQLGKEHAVYGDFLRALGAFEQSIEMTSISDCFRHDLTVRMIHAYKAGGRHLRGIEFAAEHMPHWPQSPDFFFALGDLLLDWAVLNPAQAMDQWLPMARNCWLRCLEIGEQPELDGAVAGRGSVLAAHNLAVIHQCLGQGDQAEHYRRLASG